MPSARLIPNRRIELAIAFLACIAPGVFFVACSAFGFGQVEMMIWSVLLGVPYWVLSVIAVWRLRSPSLATAALFGLALFMSVVTTNWPLRTAFGATKGRLDEIADALESGRIVSTPQWVGTFCVRRAKLNAAGMPCLWIHLGGDGPVGLVRPRDGVARDKHFIFSDLRLDEKWHFVSED